MARARRRLRPLPRGQRRSSIVSAFEITRPDRQHEPPGNSVISARRLRPGATVVVSSPGVSAMGTVVASSSHIRPAERRSERKKEREIRSRNGRERERGRDRERSLPARVYASRTPP
ncbi:hypothetical protein PUN28_005359 [Cardiocondyla obscurior]|uniref:Uncharacterized protein n=1 Tax=Cardiocondyla obscurior TaxID=286306 RepID=A0AAW2GH39_9HYME